MQTSHSNLFRPQTGSFPGLPTFQYFNESQYANKSTSKMCIRHTAFGLGWFWQTKPRDMYVHRDSVGPLPFGLGGLWLAKPRDKV